ncbi:hypothetical protein ILP92_02815 [Maribius pontilimi]|uniref:Uncharacterized protein n=1 Tax=Palleronia pontilimi TaxID=1964209 RepID=A0A934IF20_9RHOB|nr:hypothetical protein [Palleronia pontilimi]MBJ3761683.1 hypothetical protein [Palleronia pontilimi]
MTRTLAVGPQGALCDAVLTALGSLDMAAHHATDTDAPGQLLADAADRLAGPVRFLITWLTPGAPDRLDSLQPDTWDAAMGAGPRRVALLMQAFAADLPAPKADGTGELRAPGSVLNLIDQPLGFATPTHSSTAIAADALAALTRVAAVQLAPACRVNALAPATQPARLRDAAREADLSPDETRLPRAPETLARSIAHTLAMPAMTGQILFLQSHIFSADQGAVPPG